MEILFKFGMYFQVVCLFYTQFFFGITIKNHYQKPLFLRLDHGPKYKYQVLLSIVKFKIQTGRILILSHSEYSHTLSETEVIVTFLPATKFLSQVCNFLCIKRFSEYICCLFQSVNWKNFDSTILHKLSEVIVFQFQGQMLGSRCM